MYRTLSEIISLIFSSRKVSASSIISDNLKGIYELVFDCEIGVRGLILDLLEIGVLASMLRDWDS